MVNEHFLNNRSKRWQTFVLINTRANGDIFRAKKLHISLRSVFLDTLYISIACGHFLAESTSDTWESVWISWAWKLLCIRWESWPGICHCLSLKILEYLVNYTNIASSPITAVVTAIVSPDRCCVWGWHHCRRSDRSWRCWRNCRHT